MSNLIWAPEKQSEFKYICGIDEVGLGSGVGCVVAVAVILDKDFNHPLLNDSKKINKKYHKELSEYIFEHAIDVSIGEIDNRRIDEINVLNANFEAMHMALDNLKTKPDFILVDGNKFKRYSNIPYETIVKGDSKIKAIAAASIIAKYYRDTKLIELHEEHPEYSWNTNSGYLTEAHRNAIKEHGITKYHRLTFISDDLLKKQIKLF